MGIYLIRHCKKNELAKLQDFLDKHWRKSHIMSQSEALFNFQHDVVGSDHYTFVVAENMQTGEFDGVYGYISSYRYDITKQVPKIGFGAIWKVRDDVHNLEIGKIGIKMLKYILKQEDFESFGALGISKIHKDIAVALNFNVGVTNHYYYANNKVREFRIAQSPQVFKARPSSSVIKDIDLSAIDTVFNSLNPYKNVCYYRHRYLNHPYYHYIFWGVYVENELCAIIVLRKISINGSSCLRIVDMLGNEVKLQDLSGEFQRMLEKDHIEYIDCLNHGIAPDFFEKLGFNLLDNDGETVIPEYFEPFVRKNIPIEYAYISDNPIIIFKGDGDQDRPNIIPANCYE